MLTPLAALMAACADPAATIPDWCGAPAAEAGIVLLPPVDPPRGTLVERWRVGGLDTSQVIVGANRPSVSPGGRVAIPDMMASAVLVVDSGGVWRGSVTRRGKGPGEVEWPVDAEWLDEHRLAVFDLGAGAVRTIDADSGDLLDSWSLDPDLFGRIFATGSVAGVDLTGHGGLILELPWEAPSESSTGWSATVVHAGHDGDVDTLTVQAVQVLGGPPFTRFPVPGAPRPLYAAAATGPVIIGGTDTHYRVRLLDEGLEPRTTICRDIAPAPYSASERGRVTEPEGLSDLLDRVSRPDTPATLGGIFAGPEGRIWLLRTRPDPATFYGPVEGGLYDVVAGDSLLATVRAPARVALFGEAAGSVFGMERGDLDEVSIVAYRLDIGRGAR